MNNPPAFPLHNHGVQTLGLHVTGMTLRDYFAAKAMQGIYASNATHNHEDEHIKAMQEIYASNATHDHEDEHIFDAVAAAAYLQADAMLKAREKT
jgi:hypothetical protein